MHNHILEIINQLSSDSEGFLYELHQNRYFNEEKYKILLESFKKLTREELLDNSGRKNEKCLGNSFLLQLVHSFHLLIFILGDLQSKNYEINISSSDYFSQIEQLINEFERILVLDEIH